MKLAKESSLLFQAPEENVCHDYHPSWDYKLDTSPDHELATLAKGVATAIYNSGNVDPFQLWAVKLDEDSPHPEAVAVYVNGTESYPVILIDLDKHKGYEDQIGQTIYHELKHAEQQMNEQEFDENEAEYDNEPWQEQKADHYDDGEYWGEDVRSPDANDIIGKIATPFPQEEDSVDQLGLPGLGYQHVLSWLPDQNLDSFDDANWIQYPCTTRAHANELRIKLQHEAYLAGRVGYGYVRTNFSISDLQHGKLADFGDTNFQNNNGDMSSEDPKFDLDPMYKGLDVGADDIVELMRFYPDMSHEDVVELLMKRKNLRHHFDHTDDNKTMYMYDQSVNTYMGAIETAVKTGAFITYDDSRFKQEMDDELQLILPFMEDEQDLHNYREYLLKKVESDYGQAFIKLQSQLQEMPIELIVKPRWNKYLLDVLPNEKLKADFYVQFGEGWDVPGFTLWETDEGWEVEDVLSVGDTDFFQTNDATREYFSVIDKLRGTNKEDPITLYRGMSPEEYRAWEAGSIIETGKFFTDIPSEQYASDIEGVFPQLYTFRVDPNIVVQTDPHTYQLLSEGQLSEGLIKQAGDLEMGEWQKMNEIISTLKIWDNGGTTADRYSVVFLDGGLLAMGDNFGPNGISYYLPPGEWKQIGRGSHRIYWDDLPPKNMEHVVKFIAEWILPEEDIQTEMDHGGILDDTIGSVKIGKPPMEFADEFKEQYINAPPESISINWAARGYDWVVVPSNVAKLISMGDWALPDNFSISVLEPYDELEWRRLDGLLKGRTISLHPFLTLEVANTTLWHELQHIYQKIENRSDLTNYDWKYPETDEQYHLHPTEIDARGFEEVMAEIPLLQPREPFMNPYWLPNELHLDMGDWSEKEEQWQLNKEDVATHLTAQVNLFREDRIRWAETWLNVDESEFYSKVSADPNTLLYADKMLTSILNTIKDYDQFASVKSALTSLKVGWPAAYNMMPWLAKQILEMDQQMSLTGGDPVQDISYMVDVTGKAGELIEILKSMGKLPYGFDENRMNFGQLEEWYDTTITNYGDDPDIVVPVPGNKYEYEHVVYNFNNGWTIQEVIGDNDLFREETLMYKNMVEIPGKKIYSLRDPNNQPQVIIGVENYGRGTELKIVQAIEGRGGTEPYPRYKEMIKEWFVQANKDIIQFVYGWEDEIYDLDGAVSFLDDQQSQEYDLPLIPLEPIDWRWFLHKLLKELMNDGDNRNRNGPLGYIPLNNYQTGWTDNYYPADLISILCDLKSKSISLSGRRDSQEEIEKGIEECQEYLGSEWDDMMENNHDYIWESVNEALKYHFEEELKEDPDFDLWEDPIAEEQRYKFEQEITDEMYKEFHYDDASEYVDGLQSVLQSPNLLDKKPLSEKGSSLGFKCTNCGATEKWLNDFGKEECLRCGAPIRDIKPYDTWPGFAEKPVMYHEQYQSPYVSAVEDEWVNPGLQLHEDQEQLFDPNMFALNDVLESLSLNDNWILGRWKKNLDVSVQMKIFDQPSQYGINHGRISKLFITDSRANHFLANYDRGWDYCEPAGKYIVNEMVQAIDGKPNEDWPENSSQFRKGSFPWEEEHNPDQLELPLWWNSSNLSFQKIEKKLNGRDSRKIANNTYLQKRSDGSIALLLHKTDVLTFYPNKIVLSSGGWKTNTTKDRLNYYIPGSIYQRNFEWYYRPLYGWQDMLMPEVEYFDGLEIGYDGTPLNIRQSNEIADTDSPSRWIHIDRENLRDRSDPDWQRQVLRRWDEEDEGLDMLDPCPLCKGHGTFPRMSEEICAYCLGTGRDKVKKGKTGEVATPELGQITEFDFDNITVLEKGWRSYIWGEAAATALFNAFFKRENVSWEEAQRDLLEHLVQIHVPDVVEKVRNAAPEQPLRIPLHQFGSMFCAIERMDHLAKTADLTQHEISDDTVYRTDLNVWTDDHLHNLREEDKQDEITNFADEHGEVAFIYFNGEIYWGKSLDDIIARDLSHNYDLYSSPTIAGTFNIETRQISYDNPETMNFSPELKKSFLFKLKKYFMDTSYIPNDDQLHSDEEIYDTSMHSSFNPFYENNPGQLSILDVELGDIVRLVPEMIDPLMKNWGGPYWTKENLHNMRGEVIGIDDPFITIAWKPHIFPASVGMGFIEKVSKIADYWDDNLEPFIEAQNKVYNRVLTELKNGKKMSHWMWFIFPQLHGISQSDMGSYYGLDSNSEVLEYYNHPILGERLRECTNIVNSIEGKTAEEIFDWDDVKFKSCMELFASVTGDPIFSYALQKYFREIISAFVPEERKLMDAAYKYYGPGVELLSVTPIKPEEVSSHGYTHWARIEYSFNAKPWPGQQMDLEDEDKFLFERDLYGDDNPHTLREKQLQGTRFWSDWVYHPETGWELSAD